MRIDMPADGNRSLLAKTIVFGNRIRRGGCRPTAPASSSVTTSGRLLGRATGGFADYLKVRVKGLQVTSVFWEIATPQAWIARAV